ncbi:MAG: S1C family serine protease [Elusimicrobium sp.]|jgi:serine protease Do|nr:S1C family serine protease [Elusimicrobium sp.]
MKFKIPAFIIFVFLCAAAYAETHVEIAKEFASSVVTINTLNAKGGAFSGTGFVVAPDGVIATSKHVVEGAVYINVTFDTGLVSDEARLTAVSKETDLALLKIEAKNLPPVYLGDSDYALPGAEITVIGSPRRLQNTVTTGVISQVRPVGGGINWHQISAPVSSSSSGSPVFDADGNVISVVSSIYIGGDNQNLNFSIPSNYLKKLMEENGLTPAAREEKKGNAVIEYLKECFNIFFGFFR